MGESVTNSQPLDSRWTYWSQRLTLVCLAAALLLGSALLALALLIQLGYSIPSPVFQAGFYAGLGVLAIWIVTRRKGVHFTLPAARPPFLWVTSILLFILISLRYVLLIEAGVFGFLAFRPSLWRYLPSLLVIYGVMGIVKGLAGAVAERRAELDEPS
jgi:hypothetical protein